jgi:hypothetical protein
MSEALPLPSRPKIEQYKKIARDLQDARKSSDPAAIRHWAAVGSNRLRGYLAARQG